MGRFFRPAPHLTRKEPVVFLDVFLMFFRKFFWSTTQVSLDTPNIPPPVAKAVADKKEKKIVIKNKMSSRRVRKPRKCL